MKAKLLILMLGLFPLLAIGQNYEMRGDSCFNIGDYQKSVKQYNAAIELSGESTSLINKRDVASNCCSLLRQALEAESNSDISTATQYYTQLYEEHQLAKYKEKAEQYKKQIAQQETLANQKALAQSYEQEGDNYFSEGNYKIALEKYKAAIATASTSALIQKRDKTSKCYSLLTKAQEAEKKMEYSNASQLYKQLYGIHARSTYNEKAETYKRKVEEQQYAEQQKKIAMQKSYAQKYEQEGDYYFSKGDYNTAESKYKSAIYILGYETESLRRKKDNIARKLQEQKALKREEQIALAKGKYVDLGLSVKWATCNIGASKPEDLGDYFSWGETKPYRCGNWSWSIYKWCKGSETTLTKYNNNAQYGAIDNKTQLENSDDAASVIWGGAWRLPTKNELEELRNRCTWKWITQNGVDGYKVTSKTNGNSIFLPATDVGQYWSSSLSTDSPNSAYELCLGWNYADIFYMKRALKRLVRPVCP